MEEKNKNEEILSRRGFFKNAAKKALPILGVVALASMPIITKATETKATDCYKNTCTGGCYNGCGKVCEGTCSGTCTGCTGSCETGCYDTCTYYCQQTCNNGCSGSCKSVSG